MAITFRGSVATGVMTVDSGTVALAIECTPYAKVRVDILGIMAQLDSLVAVAATGRISPLFRVQKVTGVTSGGLLLTGIGAFDTSLTHDTGVIVRQSLGRNGGSGSDISYTGTPSNVKAYFSTHNTSIYGQMLPLPCCNTFSLPSSAHLYLNPGESLLVTWLDGTNPVGGEAFFTVAWEEYSLGTEYSLSGQVTISGTGVSGAKVILVTDTNRDMPTPQVEVVSTDGSGNWSKTLASGIKADAFVQYRSGETLYTAEGKPYLTKA